MNSCVKSFNYWKALFFSKCNPEAHFTTSHKKGEKFRRKLKLLILSIYWHVDNLSNSLNILLFIHFHFSSFFLFVYRLLHEREKNFSSQYYNRFVNIFTIELQHKAAYEQEIKLSKCLDASLLCWLYIECHEEMNNFPSIFVSLFHRCLFTFFLKLQSKKIFLNYSWQTN